MAASSWQSFAIQIPGKDFLKKARTILETLLVYLEVVKAFLETVKAFLVDFGNPLKVLIETLLNLINTLIVALKQTGIYALYDVEMLVYLIGQRELRHDTDGHPRGLILDIHKDSTFKDIKYLSGQLHSFASHSWRSYFPNRLAGHDQLFRTDRPEPRLAEPASGMERLGDDREDRAIPMVPVDKENAYQLREYLHRKVIESAHADPFKFSFLHSLGLLKDVVPAFDFATLSLYQRCAIAGLGILDETVSSQDVEAIEREDAFLDRCVFGNDVFGIPLRLQ